MKILIMSDSHGNVDAMRRVIKLHRDADRIVFLGDGLADAIACESEFDRPILRVKGNCDGAWTGLYKDVPEAQPVEVMGHRILLTHGHRFGVKGGAGNLASFAASSGYDIALFGHTHEPQESYLHTSEGPIYLFNPGSLTYPNNGAPTYGLLQLSEDVVLFSHGEVPQK